MIPIRDVIPSRTTPWVTFGLIALNLLVALRQMALPPDAARDFVFAYGLIPAEFSWFALLTSMFVHGGIIHVASNLLSLWIFGDNVEDRFGHLGFLVFYLAAGTLAALAEVWANPASALPMVGASGAIAGVMGAYLVMFPRSRVLVLIFLFFFIDAVEIPAVFFLGLWFLMQLVGGLGRTAAEASSGGIAFWAHAGGFLSGVIVAWLYGRRRPASDWWSPA